MLSALMIIIKYSIYVYFKDFIPVYMSTQNLSAVSNRYVSSVILK